ncbi:uncharacterized protein KZ484_026238 isoform 2-T3 [Pholidichthys leucotaenia]
MDSLLASVLTSGSLDVQNGSQCGEGPVTQVFLDPQDKTSPSTVPGNLQPSFPVKAAVTIIQDALSINGKKPEVGGTSEPAFQECKKPITNSATSQTKDFAHTRFQGPVLVSAREVTTEKDGSKIHLSAIKNEGCVYEKTDEEAEAKSFHDTEAKRGDEMCKEVLDVKIVHIDGSENPFISSTDAAKILSQQVIKEETTEGETEKNIPLLLEDMELSSCKTFHEAGMEEQTEPLDLSLPKKRERRERRCGRFLDDCGCESTLIMEVDEYDGEGDRDIVEDDEDLTNTLENSLLSPSFFSASVFTSFSSIDCDTDNLLLIDDQGIPYTLSSDGLKVLQVDASPSEDHQADQAAEVEEKGVSSGPSLSQSLDNALKAPSDDFCSSAAPVGDSLLLNYTKAPEVLTRLKSDPSMVEEMSAKSVQEATGNSVPSQPIQILTNPSTNAPVLLLSPPSSSAPVSLSLPLSVTQSSPGASTPMFLLLSSVPSSSGEATTTSTPIAVLDPATGQLSQITAASTHISLPLSSGQASTLESPLNTLSHPVIKLSPNTPPVILSGVNNVNSGSVLTSLTVPSSTLALQDDHNNSTPLIQTQLSYKSNPGSEAISAQEVSDENNKPSTFTASSPQSQTVDPLAQTTSEAEARSPDSKFEPSELHSEHLPLDDHLYFSSTAAPTSPPIGPILPPGKLDPLDPLDPLSPAASPNTAGARRVLYCQLCPRVFFYLSDLERHAITHSQKKPHICQQCGKAFKRSSHLQRHKHIHTGQRNFVCPICTKRFREAGELQRHQRVHTGEKPYQCTLCHTRFAERNTLRRHTKRKHPYHQVAMEMLNEKRDRGGNRGDGGGGVGPGMQEEEECAEWYSSTVPILENSESEMET